MADIHIRVLNCSGSSLSSVIYRLMRGEDLTHITLNADCSCYFYIDMDSDEFSDLLMGCDYERDR